MVQFSVCSVDVSFSVATCLRIVGDSCEGSFSRESTRYSLIEEETCKVRLGNFKPIVVHDGSRSAMVLQRSSFL